MKSLLVCCPQQTDATSFYRGMGPISEIKRKANGFSFQMATDVNWAALGHVDGLFMQRPFTANHLKIVQMAQMNGVPVWVDYDDDLFNVPNSNPTSKTYRDPATRSSLAQILAMASIVTVSTPFLKERLLKLNSDIRVIPNGYNARLMRYRQKPEAKPRNKLINWRGSETHQKDLYLYTKQMVELAEDNPDWTWSFIGSSFWLTTEAMPQKNVVVTEPVDPIEYFQLVHKIQPAITIVPLHDSPFNRCKSNIAWQEATFAGSLTLAPDWEEWKRPGVMPYNNPFEFKDRLLKLMKEIEEVPTLSARSVEQSWQDIQENFLLENLNKQRLAVIEELLSEEMLDKVTSKMINP